MTMTLHNYRSRQVHETLNAVNPSSIFRDMCSAKSGTNLWQIWQAFGPWASPYGANGQMTMIVHNLTGLDHCTELRMEKISQAVTGIWVPQVWQPPAGSPGPRQYPSSPEAWWVKTYHLPLDKMAAILAHIFKGIFLNENDKILIKMSLKLIPRVPIDNNPALVQVMAWCRTGDKPLPEPVTIQFTDAFMRD